MTKARLDEILKKHLKWINGEEGGEKAYLQEADLQWANLRGANLRGADLQWANLQWANLRGADLLYFTFNRHTAYFQFDGKIRIGSEYHDLDYWLDNYENIARKHSYTDLEIKGYGQFIKMCKDLSEAHKGKEN